MNRFIAIIIGASCLMAGLQWGFPDAQSPPPKLEVWQDYVYVGKVESVYDGDTMTVMVDLGFNVYKRIVVRLLDVDTPELRGKERDRGLVVRDAVRGLIDQKQVLVQSKGKGKYGRWLCRLYFEDEATGTLTDLSKYLLATGMAEKYE